MLMRIQTNRAADSLFNLQPVHVDASTFYYIVQQGMGIINMPAQHAKLHCTYLKDVLRKAWGDNVRWCCEIAATTSSHPVPV